MKSNAIIVGRYQRWIARQWLALLCHARLLGLSLAVCLAAPVHAEETGAVARGRALAIIGDCAGCHTTPRQPAFSGGLAFPTQFGTVYSTNITPDREMGIGGWSEEDFSHAVHDGVAPGGKHLYPAFPYPYFARLSRRDSDDLFAWLRTLKPVRRSPTPNRLIFPFNLRFGLYFWKLLYLDRAPPSLPATASAQWRRGEYLVNGPGHCAACHTPKNLLFGDQTDKALTGGEVDSWFAPDLTGGDSDGLGRWHSSDITAFLTTGDNRLTAAAGSMKEKITSSTSRLYPDDLAAIAAYLKSLPPGKPEHQERPRPEQMARGQAV